MRFLGIGRLPRGIALLGMLSSVVGDGSRRAAIKGSPGEFEQSCADRLRMAGWRARVVGRSGDQGADVIAELFRARLVLQCKLSGVVGNKAVQEVYAALAHHRGTIAAVVTPGVYTEGAKRLANSTGIMLLAPRDLDRIGDRHCQRTPNIKRCRCGQLIRLPASRFGFVICPTCGWRDWYVT